MSSESPLLVEKDVRFDAIYQSEFDFVWRALRRFGVEATVAEDLAQEVFVIVHRRLDSFEERSSVKTWIYGIARNVVRDHRRGKHQRVQRVELDERASSGPSPETNAANAEAVALVQQLLEGLDERKREAFVLADMEGLSAPEIAEATGTKLATVYTRIRAGRAEFKEAFARHRRRSSRGSR